MTLKVSDIDKLFESDKLKYSDLIAAKNALKTSMIKYAVHLYLHIHEDESLVIELIKKYNEASMPYLKFTDAEVEEILSLAKKEYEQKLDERRASEIKHIELDW